MHTNSVSLIKLYVVSLSATSITLLFSLFFFSFFIKLLKKYDTNPIQKGQNKREFWLLVFNSLLLNLNTILWVFLSEMLPNHFSYEINPFRIIATTIGLVLSVEIFYYSMHRWYHRNRILMKYHAEHHRSITCQPITGQAFGVFETFTINFLAPFPYILIMSCFVSLSFYGLCLWALVYYFLSIWLHSNIEFPAPIEKSLRKLFIITPSMHSDHHLKFNGNFGLYFSFFDKLFGTEIKKVPESNKK
jgi:lathosterol oxidase